MVAHLFLCFTPTRPSDSKASLRSLNSEVLESCFASISMLKVLVKIRAYFLARVMYWSPRLKLKRYLALLFTGAVDDTYLVIRATAFTSLLAPYWKRGQPAINFEH